MGAHTFISYSRTDQAYVERLIEYLVAAGVTPWVDATIDYGSRWPTVVQQAVDACAAFIVVMTPAAESSRWVGREVDEAEYKFRPIRPLLLDGGRFFRLAEHQYEDVRDSSMPSQRFVRELLALTEVGKARDLLEQERYEEALVVSQKAIHLGPDLARTHNIYGFSLMLLGRADEALAAFDTAIRIEPDTGIFHENRGRVLGGWLRRNAEAVASFNKAIQLDPNSVDAYIRRGLCLDDLGERRRALEDYDTALRLDSQNAFAHGSRGITLSNLGRWGEAVSAFQRALAIDPQGMRSMEGNLIEAQRQLAQPK